MSEVPTRSFMDDPNIKWKSGKPNYDLVNEKYLKEKKSNHPVDSLEKLVENAAKTFEMESTHKMDLNEWGSIADKDTFKFIVNGNYEFSAEDCLNRGNYQMLLAGCPLYNLNAHTCETSLALFQKAFDQGFAWELTELFSGPPKIVFSWRHWTNWTGKLGNREPTNDYIEMTGMSKVIVNDDLKMISAEVFYDPNPMMAKLLGLEEHANKDFPKPTDM
ncbi:unnamed protein product [Owenia fusiformis]|uniref:Pathogen-related protein n=1 Tax=Owenia fusiformis TaxID=6347 RepID=A0A8S4NAS8_OWEFU|nr:unnamed protein product [Owenia fusiformis]